jgi:preprotein translocase subunit SecA
MSYLDKILKYKNKYLILEQYKSQYGGEIKIRSRIELIQYLINNGSLSIPQATKLEYQLKVIDEYIYKKRILPIDPIEKKKFLQNPEEILLYEVAKVSLMVYKTRSQLPRDNQLIAVLQFLEGNNTLLQAGTGQGKSLIVAMVAILQQILKRPYKIGDSREMTVHIITTTNDLVTDAILSNKKLFDACGIRVRNINTPGYVNDVIYGTPFDFEAQALNEASNPQINQQLLDTRVRRTVILDESDSHLVDNASGRVLTSDPDPLADSVKAVFYMISKYTDEYYTKFSRESSISDGIKGIKILISNWVQQNHPNFVDRWNAEKDIWIKNAFEVYSPSPDNYYRDGVGFVLKKSLFNEIKDFIRDYSKLERESLVDAMEKFFKHIPNETIALNHLKIIFNTWLINFRKIESKFTFEYKSQYNRIVNLVNQIQKKDAKETYNILFTGAIQYLDVGTGQIISNMKFSNGVQELLELKFFKQIFTEPTISVRSYSLHRYIRESELILGLSGTVGLDSDTIAFQRKVWKITKNPIVLPEFAVPQLVNSKPDIHKNNQIEWFQAIYDAIIYYINTQPILIITENPERAHEVKRNLSNRGLQSSIYEASTDKHILEKKLEPGQIIITTNLGGRGSDYLYDSSRAPNGLHVIIGFDSDEERILAQARGRAGRAGNPGSWQKISFGPKLKQKPKLEVIQNSVRKSIGEDAIFEIYLFIKGLIEEIPEKQEIINRRINFLMSWLSNPTVRNNLLDHLTAKYNNSAYDILGAYVLQEWVNVFYLHEGFSIQNITFDQTQPGPKKLAMRIKPHIDELFRLK